MARKIKPPPDMPSMAWLMSFGDTMTTLLAFFIVLCSMAENQTGANLHAGTGSFIKAMHGSPGLFSGAMESRSVQLNDSGPKYLIQPDDENAQTIRGGKGPDDQSNDLNSLDREQEEFMRFLNAVEKSSEIISEPSTLGETTFDFFKRLSPKEPHLTSSYDDVLPRIIPLLRTGHHRVEVIVWATTPSETARSRATLYASRIVEQLIVQTGVSDEAAMNIMGTGRTWPLADVKRPVISFTVRRVDSEPDK